MAKASILNGEHEQAVQPLQDLQLAEAAFTLAYAHALGNNIDAAKASCRLCLELDPTHSACWTLLALLRTCTDELEATLTICAGELEAGGMYIPLALVQAAVLSELGSTDQAIDALKRVIAACFGRAGEFETTITYMHSRYTTAKQFYFLLPTAFRTTNASRTASMSLSPDDNAETSFVSLLDASDTPIGLSALDANPLTAASRIAVSARGFDIPEALLPSRDILARRRLTDRLLLAGRLWLAVSDVYLEAGLLDDAQQAAEQAYQLNELDADVYCQLGRIAAANGQNQTALHYWQTAYALDHEHCAARRLLAESLLLSRGSDSNADAEIKQQAIINGIFIKSFIEDRSEIDLMARCTTLTTAHDSQHGGGREAWRRALDRLRPILPFLDTVPLL